MVSAPTVIKNPSDLHLRPTGILYKEVLLYKSKVSFRIHTITADAGSVLGAFGACVKSGDKIMFVCKGSDGKEVLAVVMGVVEDGLGKQGAA